MSSYHPSFGDKLAQFLTAWPYELTWHVCEITYCDQNWYTRALTGISDIIQQGMRCLRTDEHRIVFAICSQTAHSPLLIEPLWSTSCFAGDVHSTSRDSEKKTQKILDYAVSELSDCTCYVFSLMCIASELSHCNHYEFQLPYAF